MILMTIALPLNFIKLDKMPTYLITLGNVTLSYHTQEVKIEIPHTNKVNTMKNKNFTNDRVPQEVMCQYKNKRRNEETENKHVPPSHVRQPTPKPPPPSDGNKK